MTRLINADGKDITTQTLDQLKKVMGNGQGLEKAETVTTATGLVAYDLEAPAKNLYPVLTPLRNRIPRVTKPSGAGVAANWKSVTAINGNSSMPAMPWIPEGQRAARMTITTEDKSANYRTIGLETDVSFEAQSAGAGFEDVLATGGMRLLQQTMILEELAILGGNKSVALGKPTTPTIATANTGSIPHATYKISVIALTLEGYLMASLSGIKRVETITGMDGKTFALNGGSSIASDQGTAVCATTDDWAISAYTPPVKGAVAYAWFVGVSGSEKLEAITTINSVKLTSLAGTGQALSAITDGTTDRSKNTDLAFDGLLYSAFNSSLAYYHAMATGTAGTGTPLTSSGHGSISEIDTMLLAFWNNYKISPDEIYLNSQELKNITDKVLTDGSTPLVSFNLQPNDQNPTVVAGQVVGYYFNPFSMNGGQVIPLRLHPNLPPGLLFGWCQNLPAYYQSANVPQVAEVQCRRDYYQIPWPLVTRANETGVYAEEVLKVYAPFAMGIIANIANG